MGEREISKFKLSVARPVKKRHQGFGPGLAYFTGAYWLMHKQIMACLISTVLPIAGAEWGLLKILPLPNAQIGELTPILRFCFVGTPTPYES